MPFRLKLFLITVCCIWVFVSNATDAINDKPAERSFSYEKLESYRHDGAFNYSKDYKPAVSLWDRILEWIVNHLLSPIFKNTTVTFWTIIKLIIAALTIGILINYILKSNRIGLFEDEPIKRSLNIRDIHDDIHQVDFDALIEQAAGNGQFRTAIRYLYLKSLLNLSQRSLIDWKPHKTNAAYMRELRPAAIYPLFSDLTNLFNHAWYGGSDITAESFQSIQNSFKRFHQHPDLIK